jgi:hypothetical protein
MTGENVFRIIKTYEREFKKKVTLMIRDIVQMEGSLSMTEP